MRLHHFCGDNLVTSLKVPSSLLQVVNSLFQTSPTTWNKQCERNLLTAFEHRLVTICCPCVQVCCNFCVFTRVRMITKLDGIIRPVTELLRHFKFVDNLEQALRTQLVDGLFADLLQDTSFFLLVYYRRSM